MNENYRKTFYKLLVFALNITPYLAWAEQCKIKGSTISIDDEPCWLQISLPEPVCFSLNVSLCPEHFKIYTSTQKDFEEKETYECGAEREKIFSFDEKHVYLELEPQHISRDEQRENEVEIELHITPCPDKWTIPPANAAIPLTLAILFFIGIIGLCIKAKRKQRKPKKIVNLSSVYSPSGPTSAFRTHKCHKTIPRSPRIRGGDASLSRCIKAGATTPTRWRNGDHGTKFPSAPPEDEVHIYAQVKDELERTSDASNSSVDSDQPMRRGSSSEQASSNENNATYERIDSTDNDSGLEVTENVLYTSESKEIVSTILYNGMSESEEATIEASRTSTSIANEDDVNDEALRQSDNSTSEEESP